MKTTMMLAAIPAALALTACGQSASETLAPVEAAAAGDDNDTAAPVAAPAAEETPHDESVPHDH
jgi:ADP-ribosylglycohydrolase